LKTLRAGYTLIVWKLDWLGRSLREPDNYARQPLCTRGAKSPSLTEAIATATPAGRAMRQMIGMLADYAEHAVMQSIRCRNDTLART
jgi:DNA invertase Pin-like site-specific DNA recombinase